LSQAATTLRAWSWWGVNWGMGHESIEQACGNTKNKI